MQLDTIVCGDCLDVMQNMPDNSIHLIVADFPYFKVKDETWDRQWSDPAAFLAWMGTVLEACQRVLVANGSLYVFASPEMSDHVSVKTREWFNVLENITWVKPDPSCELNPGAGRGGKAHKEGLRSYFPRTEEIIFAEHYGSDGYAKGDELRGFVFEPLKQYFLDVFNKSGKTKEEIISIFRGDGRYTSEESARVHASYKVGWNGGSRWDLCDERLYNQLSVILPLNREYEDLRREYEDLRREYEDLRRPFNASPERPYTDVWTFKTVSPYPDKHPCEKPLDLIEHIVKMSSHPGDVVFDPFIGSGTTAVAALKLDRHFYGCDINPEYVKLATQRIEKTRLEMSQMELQL